MKDKVFGQTHFEYANKIVQIFGFDSLADFTSELSYEYVKKNTTTCSQINQTFSQFTSLKI